MAVGIKAATLTESVKNTLLPCSIARPLSYSQGHVVNQPHNHRNWLAD